MRFLHILIRLLTHYRRFRTYKYPHKRGDVWEHRRRRFLWQRKEKPDGVIKII